MKRILLLTALALSVISCNKENEPQQPQGTVSYKFAMDPIVITAGEETPVTVLVKRPGTLKFEEYDWEKDEESITLTSGNTSVLEVKGKNVLVGLKPDTETKLTMVAGTLRKTATVKIQSDGCILNPNAGLTADDVFRKGLKPDASMQSFDFDSKGNMYTIGAKAPYLIVTKFDASGKIIGTMRLTFFGHGTSCAIEEAADGDYIWVPSFASQDAAKAYKGDRMISRIKFQDGKTWSTDDEEVQKNSWYIGDYTALCPSVDFESGLLGIQYASDHKNDGCDAGGKWVRIYDLKDVMAAPMADISLRQITRGGEAGGPVSKVETIYMKFKAHDLTKTEPEYKFTYNQEATYGRTVDGASIRALQGFCIGSGRAWFLAGYGPNRDGAYSSYRYSGEKDRLLVHFGCIDDASNLLALGLAQINYEPEGIQVKGRRMYVGFNGKPSGTSVASILRIPE